MRNSVYCKHQVHFFAFEIHWDSYKTGLLKVASHMASHRVDIRQWITIPIYHDPKPTIFTSLEL